ncbi:hypothetical protein [Neobacillus cucumis]|uniref:hypothetical protein n=1 Tax=Neobacillus cucumis TaxID=1740721 RepID=UPI0028532884|nr:hypothetical protein [Neobacillus cucumis]MDR4949492.1 hypothetical protein [Neobacillus cucumis]
MAKQSLKYKFEKLQFCKKCQRYSVLTEEKCPVCDQHYKKLSRLIRSTFIKRIVMETLWYVVLVGLGIIFAPSKKDMDTTLVAGCIFFLSHWVLTFIFLKSEYYTLLKKKLREDLSQIQEGIRFDFHRASEDSKEGRLQEALDKLQEIGDLVDSDEVKIRQVIVLTKAAIRSDVELELEKLLPTRYDKHFVIYALEVLKFNRAQVRKSCIAYFLHFRRNIEMDFGVGPLIAMADTALRMKLYIHEFAGFIEEFLEYLPKERFRRLCGILDKNPQLEWGRLKRTAVRLIEKEYRHDPDFQTFFQKERAASHA